MCSRVNNAVQFFLVHPGGPFYAKKDEGVWTIPKGLAEPGEDLLLCAQREFREETGIIPGGEYSSLGIVKLKSGKIVHGWMFFGKWDEKDGITSNTFPLEWPPKSKRFIDIPEADRGGWFEYDDALKKIHPQQQAFLFRAIELIERAS
jgi:predicted NUDIX family NTP pyrophosphohydrolase